MKKKESLILFALSALTLTGCAGNSSASSSDALSSESSSEGESWDAMTQVLMDTYCGQTLPYCGDLFESEANVKECTSSSGDTYLQIYFDADSFLMKDYYKDLEKAGWDVIEGYGDKAIRSDEAGTEFCELTRVDNEENVGYNISYFFYPGTSDSTGKVSGAYNCIWCYNNATTSLTEDTSWGETDAANLKYVLMNDVPFFQLGSDYVSYRRSEDEVIVYDYCAIDCRSNVSKVLKDDGYSVDAEESEKCGYEVLTKTFEDGSVIAAELIYSSGNLIQFDYTPAMNKSKEWPSSVLAPIEEATGVKIPEFAVKGSYAYYTKRGFTYIYGYTSGELYSDYSKKLTDELGLTTDYLGNFTNWEENLYLYCTNLTNSSHIVIGFEIVVAVVQSDSKFSAQWPEEEIKDFLATQSITLSCPTPSTALSSGKSIKYTVESDVDYWENYWYEYLKDNADWMGVDTSDDAALHRTALKTAMQQIGVFMDVYDPDYAYAAAFKKQLHDLGWHFEADGTVVYYDVTYENGIYEDPTGTLAIHFYRTSDTVSRISVLNGCGKAHTPVFKFKESAITLGLNDSATLEMTIDMLPYEVSFSTDDTTGKVHIDSEGKISIDEDATVGQVVKVTATMNVPGESTPRTASCEVTISDRTPYNVDSAYDAAAKLINDYRKLESSNKIRRNYLDEEETIGYYELSFRSASVKSLKTAVEGNLVPEGFEQVGEGWGSGTTIWGAPSNTIRYKCDGIILEYEIYVSDGVTLLICIVYKEGTEIDYGSYTY